MAAPHQPLNAWEEDYQARFDWISRYVRSKLYCPDIAAEVAQVTILQDLSLRFICRRHFPDDNATPVTRGGGLLELIVGDAVHLLRLDQKQNTLDGLIAAIRVRQAGVLPEKKHGGEGYTLTLVVAKTLATIVELREVPGESRSNLLDPPEEKPFSDRVVANCRLIDELRKGGRLISLDSPADRDDAPPPVQHRDTRTLSEEEIVQREHLRAILDKLEPEYRLPLYLRHVKELGYDEIRDRLGCKSLGTAHSRVAAAQRRFRALMGLSSRLIVAVEGGEMLANHQKQAWLAEVDIVVGSVQPMEHLYIYSVRHHVTSQIALFEGQTGLNGARSEAMRKLKEAIAGKNTRSVPSLLTVLDQIQRDPGWNTRLLLFVANTLALPSQPLKELVKERWNKNLLAGVPVRIVPLSGVIVDLCYPDLIDALDGQLVPVWPRDWPWEARSK